MDPIGTSIYAVNLTLKLVCATAADADIGHVESLKSLHICTTCQRNLNKIVWSELHEILSFSTKNGLIKTIFDKVLAPF